MEYQTIILAPAGSCWPALRPTIQRVLVSAINGGSFNATTRAVRIGLFTAQVL